MACRACGFDHSPLVRCEVAAATNRIATNAPMRLTEDGKDYVVLVPDGWIVLNPLWSLLAPEIVEAAELRIAERENPTTDTSGTT